MLGRDIANVSNLDLVLHHASEDLSQTATSGGSESRKRRAMIRTNSNSSREKETSSKTCHVSNIFPSALLPQVVSRGDWQKNQYRSFVPFLHTLVPYPNQRRKSIGQNSFLRSYLFDIPLEFGGLKCNGQPTNFLLPFSSLGSFFLFHI